MDFDFEFDDEYLENLESMAVEEEDLSDEPWMDELHEKLEALAAAGFQIAFERVDRLAKARCLLAEIVNSEQLSGEVSLRLSQLEESGCAAAELETGAFTASARRFTSGMLSQTVNICDSFSVLPADGGRIRLRCEINGIAQKI